MNDVKEVRMDRHNGT